MVGLPRKEEVALGAGRWRRISLLFLSLLAGAIAAFSLWRLHSEGSGWTKLSTAIGNYRRLPLPDDSLLELNTATEVRYQLSQQLRQLKLVTGEARLRVRRDTERPFVVSARDTVIRAAGSEFTVRVRDPGKVEVVVAKGAIEVSHRVRESMMRKLQGGRTVPVPAEIAVPEGSMVTDDSGRFELVEMSRSKIEARDAWRYNMLVFEDTPLREIVEEFNRYDRRKLEITDPEIEDVLLTGQYRLRDMEGFLRYLGTVMEISVVEERDWRGRVVLRVYREAAE